MSCTYTFSGQLRGCKDGTGGIKEVYIQDATYLSGYTTNLATEVITGMTLSSGSTFLTYQLRKQQASMTTTVTTSDNGTTSYQTDVVFTIPKMEAAKRLEFKSLSLGDMIVIVRDNNDEYWVLGLENPVSLGSGVSASGTNFTDANNYTYTLTEISKNPPYSIDKSILSALIDSNISLPLPA